MIFPRSSARIDPLGVGGTFSRFLRSSSQRNSALMRMPAARCSCSKLRACLFRNTSDDRRQRKLAAIADSIVQLAQGSAL
jgi:hypothetical protein